jgi:hypothetical protein
MKTKFYWVALLASAALIGQAQGGGNHGGGGMGGGFGGGGHVSGGGGRAGPVGGGFRSGGFHAAGPAFGGARRSFGVGARGGGVGFGIPRYRQPVYYNGRVARSVTPSIDARTAASRPQNRLSSTRNPVVGQRPAAAFNRPAIPSAARSPGTAAHRGLNGRTDHIAERHDANWHRDWDRRHAHFDHGHFFVFDNGFWFGLDDGFYPWDYLPYYADDYYPYDYYADGQSYNNTEPVNNGAPAPDATVESIQERLAQLGYYNGPVDGVFGPTTRDAVANYQVANQLNVTGSLSPDTLQSLGLPQPTAS